MEDRDKIEYGKGERDISHQSKEFAGKRTSELADEFTRLEVQVAIILITFAGIFLGFFNTKVAGYSDNLVFFMRFMFAFSLFFLILSLILGLLHIKRKELWWDEMLKHHFYRHRKWLDYLRGPGEGKPSFEEAIAYQDGVNLENKIYHSPLWSWVLQTISLGFAFILFFVIFLIFLFHK